MADPIVITLRGQPAGKGRPRFRIITPRVGKPFGSVYTPKETRDYEDALKYAGRVAMGRKPLLDGPLDVVVEAVMSVPSSWSRKKRDAALSGVVRPTGTPDLDNIMKGACDALNETVWTDDKQIVRAVLEKRYGEQPMLRVTVRPIEPFDELAA